MNLTELEEKYKALGEEIERLKAQEAKPKPKFWRPKEDETAWCIDLDSSIECVAHWSQDEINYNAVYPTKKAAEKARDLHLCEMRLKEAIFELNEGKEYPFTSKKVNYAIELLFPDLISAAHQMTKLYPNWFYLKDMNACLDLIQTHRDDLIMWLGQ